VIHFLTQRIQNNRAETPKKTHQKETHQGTQKLAPTNQLPNKKRQNTHPATPKPAEIKHTSRSQVIKTEALQIHHASHCQRHKLGSQHHS
jgi:hypothetical protein